MAKRIASEGEKSICTSIVVAAELRFGANKRGSVRLTTQLEMILSAMEILPLEEPADYRYAELRNSLENRGTPIGPNAMFIAAHALALDCIVITTANEREFSRPQTMLNPMSGLVTAYRPDPDRWNINFTERKR